MAPNVFGNPITDETLKAMPEYANKETITSEDRAQIALNLKENVVKLAEELVRTQFPEDVKTFGIIYNATGHPLTYTLDHDWCGHVDESSYPHKIENGQCATFVHVGDYPKGPIIGAPKESIGAVVYFANSGLIGGFCKWVLAWYNVGSVGEKKIYTEFQAPQVVEQKWEAVREKLESSGQEKIAHGYGFKAIVSIGNGNTPTLIGTITSGGLPPNA